MFEFWSPLTTTHEDVLRAAAAHPDGMALTTEKIARVLEKRGLVESYGNGRVCISEKGLAWARERRTLGA